VVYAASAAESLVAIIDVKTRVLTVRGSQNFFGVNIPLLVSVTDRGGLSAVDTVSVTIRPVNDGPTLAALAPVTLPEDDSLYLPVSGWAAALTDPDDDFDHHTWDLPATRHLNITRSQGGFTIRPVKNWNGVDTLRVAVTDPEGLSASVPMIVRVQPVNDPVVLHRLSSDSLAFTDILFRLPIECHDPDGPDSLIRYRWAGPEWLKITAGGTLEGRPRAIGDFSGVLYASDPEGGEDSVHIRLRVRSNDETHDLANSLPVDFVLKQNYPNPFNPSTTVRFGVPVPSEVRLTVYSLLGQRVELLLETSVPAGYHEVPWNARGLSSGVYILEMSARSRESSPRNFRELKKLILEK
jgi:hypothetical protein